MAAAQPGCSRCHAAHLSARIGYSSVLMAQVGSGVHDEGFLGYVQRLREAELSGPDDISAPKRSSAPPL